MARAMWMMVVAACGGPAVSAPAPVIGNSVDERAGAVATGGDLVLGAMGAVSLGMRRADFQTAHPDLEAHTDDGDKYSYLLDSAPGEPFERLVYYFTLDQGSEADGLFYEFIAIYNEADQAEAEFEARYVALGREFQHNDRRTIAIDGGPDPVRAWLYDSKIDVAIAYPGTDAAELVDGEGDDAHD